MKGRAYFEAMGQRAASLKLPRWMVHHNCPTALVPLWAIFAWFRGYDNQSRATRTGEPHHGN